jgi:hypothetical protein
MTTTKLTIILEDGTTEEVEGIKFGHQIDGRMFWFLLHDRPRACIWNQISEIGSARRVIAVPHYAFSTHLGDKKAAAKAHLKKWLTGRNQSQVRQVIEDAHKFN